MGRQVQTLAKRSAFTPHGDHVMINIHKTHSILTALLLTAVFVIPSQASAQRFKPGDTTIAGIAEDSSEFTTLEAALKCTELEGTSLFDIVDNPEAELTVFAPNDTAFGLLNLDASNVCSTFDQATLTTILLYHVVGERRPSPSVINGRNKSIEMLAGGSIYPQGQRSLIIEDEDGNEVEIDTADVLASNGIIHIVKSVLMPAM